MTKKGERKLFCKHGHEIAIVGRDKRGNCRGCLSPVSLGLREPKPRKTICKYGHDLMIVGRNKWGFCIGCITPVKAGLRTAKPKFKPPKVQFCPKGHDTFVCGRHPSNYQCNDCRYEQSHPKFCPKGHEYTIVGKLLNHQCKVCSELPWPQFCIHDHDTFVCGRTPKGRCKECIRLRKKEYHQRAKAKLAAKARRYYEGHKVEHAIKGKEYRETHKEEIRKNKTEHEREKRRTDIEHRLKSNLRRRLLCAIKNSQKVGSAVRDLGCTIPFLKDYIAAKFHGGMTWDNWGRGKVWELDHIIPLWKFDLTNREQFLQANHYTNLQPLTIEEHKKKTAKEKTEWAELRKKAKGL